jgi:ABC-type glycerol-3-phosphate transport system permease component
LIKEGIDHGYGTTQISEAAPPRDALRPADFHRGDHVPAADGYRHLLRSGNFATGSLIPDEISWEHWKLALGFSVEHADGRVTPPPFPVLLWLWNSVKVAGITAIGIVALSTTCAYAFARMRFPGKATLLKGMLIFQMFPAVLSLVALYALFDRLGQYIPFIGLNTHGGVIFAYLGGIALHVWTIKGYFETIDGSLEEAAALDGATRGRRSAWCCCRCRCRFWRWCLSCRLSPRSPKYRSPHCCCAM